MRIGIFVGATAANYINCTHIRLPVAYHWRCYGIHAAGCGTLIPEHFSTNSSTGWFGVINPSCIIASMMLPQGIALGGYFTAFCDPRQAMFFKNYLSGSEEEHLMEIPEILSM